MQPLAAQQRYATLQAMGVTLWVPRKRLPHAASSSQCDWPQQLTPVRGKDKLRAEMQSQPAQTRPEPPPPTPSTPPPKTEPLQAVAPLTVDVWLLANGWQLVLERESQSHLTQEHLILVQNLLAALYPGGMGILSQHVFAWPLPGVPLEKGDQDELNLSLRAFLTGAQFRSPPVGILVFGNRSSQLLATPLASLPLAEVYSGPDLNQLLQEPAAKCAFWQDAGVSGLRARFASSPVMM